MEKQYFDQVCTRCGAMVTAKDLRKGAREHYEFVLLNLHRDQIEKHMILCTLCQVNQDKFYKMEPLLPENKF